LRKAIWSPVSVGTEAIRREKMAKEIRPRCPFGCPVCCFYQAGGTIQEELRRCVPRDVAANLAEAARELHLAAHAFLDQGLGTWIHGPKPGSRRKAQKVKLE
jgi:hypothetical protein